MQKKIINFFYIVAVTFLCLMAVAIIGKIPILKVVYAPPTVHQFYGSVYNSDGSAVNDGIIVYAVVNGEINEETRTLNGRYGFNPFFIVEGVVEGSLIEFYIDSGTSNIKVAEYNFENFGLTELNLVFSQQGGSGNGGGSSGGGSSGSSGGGGGGSVAGAGKIIVDIPETPGSEEAGEKETGKGITGKVTEEELEQSSNSMFFLIAGVVIVAVIVLIVFLRKKE